MFSSRSGTGWNYMEDEGSSLIENFKKVTFYAGWQPGKRSIQCKYRRASVTRVGYGRGYPQIDSSNKEYTAGGEKTQ